MTHLHAECYKPFRLECSIFRPTSDCRNCVTGEKQTLTNELIFVCMNLGLCCLQTSLFIIPVLTDEIGSKRVEDKQVVAGFAQPRVQIFFRARFVNFN